MYQCEQGGELDEADSGCRERGGLVGIPVMVIPDSGSHRDHHSLTNRECDLPNLFFQSVDFYGPTLPHISGLTYRRWVASFNVALWITTYGNQQSLQPSWLARVGNPGSGSAIFVLDMDQRRNGHPERMIPRIFSASP